MMQCPPVSQSYGALGTIRIGTGRQMHLKKKCAAGKLLLSQLFGEI
jgi:hypothetical protein